MLELAMESSGLAKLAYPVELFGWGGKKKI